MVDNEAPVSSKWTAVQKAGSKRKVPPPSSDDYSTWTVDQLKLECTSRKLAVAKNTNKSDRVTILRGYDDSRVSMELLLESQRLGKRGRGANEDTAERRSRHCLYRLLNVLFSELFFARFITSGDSLTRRELDDGGRRFWEEVAEAFNTANDDFDRLVSSDSLFEGIQPHQITTHSAAKLKSMWKECSARFATAEGKCKLSGSHDEFWEFCHGDKVAMYVHLWCEQRGSGREFC
ncbi:hypothetical protein PR002_g31311 [Phytophthora rubi]|uniref:Uncharacterized protein n=1 Tax=Phytophthora rubi TaxID=129364 RepID=A0A6A3GHM7_9STRA|nr:hypothetical protein PR002_g31311 [Phytophthora rubi]